MQGEGGFIVPPREFVQGVREICDREGIVMIVDEVQTGFGRTGKMFAIEHFGVEPDLMTVAKSIAAGLPLSGVLGKAEIMDAPGDSAVGGTYVGNPVAQAAALAVLDVFEDEGLVDRAERIGETVRGRMIGMAGAPPADRRRPRPRRDARDRARPGSGDEGAGPGARLPGHRGGRPARAAAPEGRRPLELHPRALPARDHGLRSWTRLSASGKRRSRPFSRSRLGRSRVLRSWPHSAPRTTPAQTAMLGEVIADRYELVELVGTGGMSSVYKAHDRLLERNVALKILHPHYGDDEEYVERFRREARMVAQMSHPHIVTVIDRGEDDGQQYIVFEYVDGENLKQLVERTGPLPVRRVVELGVAIADALAFAHEHGLVHRDVKPQNVLLTPDGEAKVTDFGIARSLDVEHGVTQTGTVLGTSNYLSPEQASGKPVTPATDVYSLGVVLYELLTGGGAVPGRELRRRRDEARQRAACPTSSRSGPDVAAPPRRGGRARAREGSRAPLRLDGRVRVRSCGSASPSSRRPTPSGRSSQPSPVLRESRPHRVRTRRRRWPLYLVLVALAAAAIVAGVLTLGGSKGGEPAAQPATGGAVPLTGVGAYDPDGGDGEHDADAPKATDGDLATYWNTEHYNTASSKRGVGVVARRRPGVEARERHRVERDTPGFTASITSGSSPNGPFVTDSASKTVNGTTTFSLNGRPARYYVVWITHLGSNASVARSTKSRAQLASTRASERRSCRSSASSISRSTSSRVGDRPTPRRASRRRSSR